MAKMMLLIDGTWLYANMRHLGETYGGREFKIDFGKLPQVLAEAVQEQLGGTAVDVVRTYLFGSYASKHDARDNETVERRLDFFDRLREEFHYELELFPINFRGRRIRKQDRDPNDGFEPKEKCVDISLATSLLYFAAIPYAYDIAIAVLGDQDFKPVLQHVRRLGKRVAIVSIKDSCAPDYADPRDGARVKDFDIIWLDDLLNKLELRYESQLLECQSSIHTGDRRQWTTFRPRKGQPFYCEECMRKYAQQRRGTEQDPARQPVGISSGGDAANDRVGDLLTGVVYRMFPDRGYGFIRSESGSQYHFNEVSLRSDTEFQALQEGEWVEFVVMREPCDSRAGATHEVRLFTKNGLADNSEDELSEHALLSEEDEVSTIKMSYTSA